VTARAQARPLSLADAFAAGRHPEILEHLGGPGQAVLDLRERHRVGALAKVIEYVTMTASVLGAAALFSGRMSPRIDYDFDAAFALPVAAIGFGIALAGLLVLHAAVIRPGLPISANAVAAAVVTAVFGVIAVILLPIKAADWDASRWQVHLVPVVVCTAVAAVSCALQVRWGVGRVRPDPSTSDSQRRALQWAALPEPERTRILDDRDRAVRLLVERGLITEEQARRHVDSPASL
jgi:hypothetical protein